MGHIRYYTNFIKGYAHITTPMEKLLRKEAKLHWNEDCQKVVYTLKHKLFTAPILIFQDWNKEFHSHVDASFIYLCTILSQIGEGEIDYPITFAGRMFSTTKKNYTMR
jgi:hypothetical protein